MVYLICFDQPLKHAKHYIGFVLNPRKLKARMKLHKTDKGSRLMAAVNRAGIGWQVTRTWKEGDRNFERKLKNQKNSSRLCPICKLKNKLL